MALSDIDWKIEEAVRLWLINEEVLQDIQILHSDDYEALGKPAIILLATSDEFPEGTGNFRVNLTCTLWFQRDDNDPDDIKEMWGAMNDRLLYVDLPAKLTEQVADLHVYGVQRDRPSEKELKDRGTLK